MRKIEIDEDTAELLNSLGGTLDTPNDIVHRALKSYKEKGNGGGESGESLVVPTKTEPGEWSEANLKRFLRMKTNPREKAVLGVLTKHSPGWVALSTLKQELKRNSKGEPSSSLVGGVIGGLGTKCGDRPKLIERQSGKEKEYRLRTSPSVIPKTIKSELDGGRNAGSF